MAIDRLIVHTVGNRLTFEMQKPDGTKLQYGGEDPRETPSAERAAQVADELTKLGAVVTELDRVSIEQAIQDYRSSRPY